MFTYVNNYDIIDLGKGGIMRRKEYTLDWILTILSGVCIGFLIAMITVGITTMSQDLVLSNIDSQEQIIEIRTIETKQTVSHYIKERVEFTNYYVNDGYGSTVTTSSGLTTDKFKINEKGWYTYNGKVVIATATNLCLEITTGACGKYNERKDTHHYFDLFDIVTITFDGIEYKAIVLDSCGACNWDTELQRIDIFVSGIEYSFGKTKGTVMY